jgi:hypothetical protein
VEYQKTKPGYADDILVIWEPNGSNLQAKLFTVCKYLQLNVNLEKDIGFKISQKTGDLGILVYFGNWKFWRGKIMSV